MPFLGTAASSHLRNYIQSTGVWLSLSGALQDSPEFRIVGTPKVAVDIAQYGGVILGTVTVYVIRRGGEQVALDTFTVGAVGTPVRREYNVIAARALIVRWADNGGGGVADGLISASAG